jgi:alcohol dehydrogenase YqhD (iron-dependent ADH family)
MIEDFSISIGTKFVFGHDAVDKLGEELAQIGARRALIHHDGGSYLERSGLLDRVRKSLADAGVSYVELGGVQPNPRLSLVRRGITLVREESVDVIVPVGGGSVIDSAKAIALGVPVDFDVWDLFTGQKIPTSTLPVASVLTNPASGSESSQAVVINNAEEGEKLTLSMPLVRPELAIMDPELCCSLPKFPTACGIVDMFSHICERYFTPDADFGVVDYMAEGALRSIVAIAPKVMSDPSDYGLRAELMWTATVAQNNTLGVGRQQDWSCHLLGNELSALYDTPHGASLSIIMPSWMRASYSYNLRRFARYAREVFGIRDEDMDLRSLSVAGIEATERFFSSLDMPVCFADYGVPADGIERMLDNIDFFGDDRAIGSVARLGRRECEGIYRDAARRR